MKKLFAVIISMLVSVVVFAEVGTVTFTNRVPAATTNSVVSTSIPVGRTNISIFLSWNALTNTGNRALGTSSNSFVQFDVSPDGQNWYSDTRYRLLLGQNGTNTVTGWTNFDTSGLSYTRAAAFENSATNISLTNIVIQWFYK